MRSEEMQHWESECVKNICEEQRHLQLEDKQQQEPDSQKWKWNDISPEQIADQLYLSETSSEKTFDVVAN